MQILLHRTINWLFTLYQSKLNNKIDIPTDEISDFITLTNIRKFPNVHILPSFNLSMKRTHHVKLSFFEKKSIQ